MKKTVWIVAAHPLEVKELKKKLNDYAIQNNGMGYGLDWFDYKGIRLGILVVGVGNKQTLKILEPALEEQSRLDLLINIGWAGGVAPDMKKGNWVIGERFWSFSSEDFNYSEIEAIDLTPIPYFETAFNFFESSAYLEKSGTIVTLEKPLYDRQKKEELFGKTKALVVDMEAFLIAKTALSLRVPFLCLKVVSDSVEEESQAVVKSAVQHGLVREIADVSLGIVSQLGSKDEN